MSNELSSDDAACIGSDMRLNVTEQNLIKAIAQLEAEKAELLQMVIKLHGSNVYQLSETDMRDGIRFPFALYDEVTALIQKHAKP